MWFLAGVICGAVGLAWVIWKYELPRHEKEVVARCSASFAIASAAMEQKFANAAAQLMTETQMQAYKDGHEDCMRRYILKEPANIVMRIRQMEILERKRAALGESGGRP